MQSRRSMHRTIREDNFNCTLPLAQTAQNFLTASPLLILTIILQGGLLSGSEKGWNQPDVPANQLSSFTEAEDNGRDSRRARKFSDTPAGRLGQRSILITSSFPAPWGCCAVQGPGVCWACRRFVSLPRGPTHGTLLLALREATLPDFYSRGG